MSRAQEQRAEEIVESIQDKLYRVRQQIAILKLEEKELEAQLARAQESGSY